MSGVLFAGFAYLGFNLVSAALAVFLTGLPRIAGMDLPVTVDASVWPLLPPWLALPLLLGRRLASSNGGPMIFPGPTTATCST